MRASPSSSREIPAESWKALEDFLDLSERSFNSGHLVLASFIWLNPGKCDQSKFYTYDEVSRDTLTKNLEAQRDQSEIATDIHDSFTSVKVNCGYETKPAPLAAESAYRYAALSMLFSHKVDTKIQARMLNPWEMAQAVLIQLEGSPVSREFILGATGSWKGTLSELVEAALDVENV